MTGHRLCRRPRRATDALRGLCAVFFFQAEDGIRDDRKTTGLNSSHQIISYAVFCLKKKKNENEHNGNGVDHEAEAVRAVVVAEDERVLVHKAWLGRVWCDAGIRYSAPPL